MELTLSYIETKFNEFNAKYFESKLKTPKFEIMNTKRLLGQCCWTNKQNCETGKNIRCNYRIRISKFFKCTEKQYCNTILHEMIHLYIRQQNINTGRWSHGYHFYAIADRINKDGWNIRRTDDRAGIELTEKQTNTYYLAAFMDTKGKYFLMRYNRNYQAYYVRLFAKYNYTGVIWFTSNDDAKYATFRECRNAIRGWYITKGEYNEIEQMYKKKEAV